MWNCPVSRVTRSASVDRAWLEHCANREPSGFKRCQDSISWAGSDEEPDRDDMEPRGAVVFKVSAAPGAGRFSRRFDFLERRIDSPRVEGESGLTERVTRAVGDRRQRGKVRHDVSLPPSRRNPLLWSRDASK